MEVPPNIAMRARVFSGIQPTGSPHIGNYLGALKNWAKIQYDYDSIYCIVDLHAVTVYQDPAELRAKIEELAGMLLAIGIDPTHSALVVQSSIPAHAELAWMLTCVTPVGWLERMTQYKAKSATQMSEGLRQAKDRIAKEPRQCEEAITLEDREKAIAGIKAGGPPRDAITGGDVRQSLSEDEHTAEARTRGEIIENLNDAPRDAVQEQLTIGDGVLQYPVLMAADILLYNAAIVPVGDDQKQHVELTRDIAQRFNSLYGRGEEFFVVPETRMPAVGARVMGLDNPYKKMSKSAAGSGHAISLLDPPEVIRKKFMRATTDSNPGVDFENLGAGVQNLLTIFQAFTGCTDDALESQFAGMRYGDLKKTVAEAVVAALEPIQKRYREIMEETGYVARVLAEGAERIIPIANQTVERVKAAMGLYTRR
jgi:tryptophanyl-tRNA synthetase